MPNESAVDNELMPPPISIGHVTLSVSDIGSSAAFYCALGLRPVLHKQELAILELRGGTHLILFRTDGKIDAGPVGTFDFMVQDVKTVHAAMEKVGIKGTDIAEDHLGGHLWFEVTDPDGHVVKIFSSHTEGRAV
jgi:catechol 2,3-dioxygenase-like lactoylglutathione lyase family enzyme